MTVNEAFSLQAVLIHATSEVYMGITVSRCSL